MKKSNSQDMLYCDPHNPDTHWGRELTVKMPPQKWHFFHSYFIGQSKSKSHTPCIRENEQM